MNNKVTVKENKADKTYNRTLFIVLIITVFLLIVGIASAIVIPYVIKHVATSVEMNFTPEHAVKAELEEDGTLKLDSYNYKYAYDETLVISTEMEHVTKGTAEKPTYIYYAKTDGKELMPIYLDFSIYSSRYEMKSCSFVISMGWSDGVKIIDLYDGDYTLDYLKDNNAKIEFKYKESNTIINIKVKYSILEKNEQ